MIVQEDVIWFIVSLIVVLQLVVFINSCRKTARYKKTIKGVNELRVVEIEVFEEDIKRKSPDEILDVHLTMSRSVVLPSELSENADEDYLMHQEDNYSEVVSKE